MNRTDTEVFLKTQARMDRELADLRELVEVLLGLFLCPVCGGEGMIEDEEYDSGFSTCEHCDGACYSRKCGVK